jgi:hypothetical protein
MMEFLLKVFASRESSFCDLPVTVEGMRLKVGAGKVRFAGLDYEVVEDEVASIVVAPYPLSVEGHLVETTTGDLRLFVFEFEHNGGDRVFDPQDFPELRFIHLLFFFCVPPKTTDLSTVERTVNHVVAPLVDAGGA